jgi:Trk K+ transport system NAD-binding subunit
VEKKIRKGVQAMQKVLLIGASEFGRDLAEIFREENCTVDLLDKEASIAHETPRVADHFFCTNALNIGTLDTLQADTYDICIVCFWAESWMLLHILRSLRSAGAKNIYARVDRRQKQELEKQPDAAGIKWIDIEQIAGEHVAASLQSMC